MSTIFATFVDAAMAQRAVGALLDHGAEKNSISLIGNQTHEELWKAENRAKSGVTTTSGADAAHGAAVGAGIGLGIGVLGGLAALFIPGFGLVVGGSAMATALAAAAATTAAGAFTGAVEGYLVDQGVPQALATDYRKALENGSALLSIDVPSGKLDRVEAEQIIAKYNGGQSLFR